MRIRQTPSQKTVFNFLFTDEVNEIFIMKFNGSSDTQKHSNTYHGILFVDILYALYETFFKISLVQ